MAAVNPDADSRELILAAAERVMGERGVEAASLAEIAKAAGVSRGTLFYHFPAKDELLLEVAERHMRSLTESVLEAARAGPREGEGPEEGVARALEALVEGLLADEARSAMHIHLVHCAFEGKEGVRARLAESYRAWTALVEGELERRGLAGAEAAAAAEVGRRGSEPGLPGRLVVALMDGLVIQGRVLGPLAAGEAKGAARLVAAAACARGGPAERGAGARSAGRAPGGAV